MGCAKGLVGVVTTGGEEHQMLVEKAEILRRDWSAKVREPHPLITNYNITTNNQALALKYRIGELGKFS